jgi:predicted dehydrogenase
VVDVLVVGLGFGAHFIPAWLSHPDVGQVALVDRNEDRLAVETSRFGLGESFTSLEAALASDGYDAVHLVTPPLTHAAQSVEVLRSGRHCAVAVPMGMTLQELDQVIEAADDSGRNFMMMETAVYQAEFLYVERLNAAGELGDLSFLAGAHLRDRTGMPPYWQGWPPLKYATHAISPLLAISGLRAEAVHAFGSGRLLPHQVGQHGNPFPIETAIYSLADSPVKMQITQASFAMAREAYEGSSVYGSRRSVEWPQSGSALQVYSMPDAAAQGAERMFRQVDRDEVVAPLDHRNLPRELVELSETDTFVPANGDPFQLGRPHSGSHPHLVHEFVASIVEGRRARVDERTAAAWCAAGICGHESAVRGGTRVEIPDYRSKG